MLSDAKLAGWYGWDTAKGGWGRSQSRRDKKPFTMSLASMARTLGFIFSALGSPWILSKAVMGPDLP